MAVTDLISENEVRPLVVVSVGTDHHRFDRLIQWTEEFAASRPEIAFVVQRGTSRTPKGVISQELIPHSDIQEMFRRAIVVVSHGGPSTVMDARAQGRLPLVVPRNPEFGEHVDGHQMSFATHLEANDIANVARTEVEFTRLLNQGIEDPASASIDIADVSMPPGVIRLGQVLDDLLGISTPLVDKASGMMETKPAAPKLSPSSSAEQENLAS